MMTTRQRAKMRLEMFNLGMFEFLQIGVWRRAW